MVNLPEIKHMLNEMVVNILEFCLTHLTNWRLNQLYSETTPGLVGIHGLLLVVLKDKDKTQDSCMRSIHSNLLSNYLNTLIVVIVVNIILYICKHFLNYYI